MKKAKVTITFDIPLTPMTCEDEVNADKMIEKLKQYVKAGDLVAQDLIDMRIEHKIDIKIGDNVCPRCLKYNMKFICKPCYESLVIKRRQVGEGFKTIFEKTV